MSQIQLKIDKTVFKAYKMANNGNIDFQYWFNKSNNEKLIAAADMIAVAFNEPDFLMKKVDRTIFSIRKQKL